MASGHRLSVPKTVPILMTRFALLLTCLMGGCESLTSFQSVIYVCEAGDYDGFRGRYSEGAPSFKLAGKGIELTVAIGAGMRSSGTVYDCKFVGKKQGQVHIFKSRGGFQVEAQQLIF